MNYKLIGQRNLRKYTEDGQSPTYAASIEAQNIVNALCDIKWSKTSEKDAIMTYHTEEIVDEVDGEKINGLDMNVLIRDKFDAALFCADHTGGQHRAYANAAVYHYELPDGTLPKLTKLTASVTSDPYNSMGARIAILTNATGVIPTNCNECRTGDAHADGVAPRTVAENGNWFPTMADCVFSATPSEGDVALPSGGLQLQKHLFVFVLMESYSTVRGNWLEGCSFIKNEISIETDAAVPGWTNGNTYDLSEPDGPWYCVYRHAINGGGLERLFRVPDGAKVGFTNDILDEVPPFFYVEHDSLKSSFGSIVVDGVQLVQRNVADTDYVAVDGRNCQLIAPEFVASGIEVYPVEREVIAAALKRSSFVVDHSFDSRAKYTESGTLVNVVCKASFSVIGGGDREYTLLALMDSLTGEIVKMCSIARTDIESMSDFRVASDFEAVDFIGGVRRIGLLFQNPQGCVARVHRSSDDVDVGDVVEIGSQLEGMIESCNVQNPGNTTGKPSTERVRICAGSKVDFMVGDKLFNRVFLVKPLAIAGASIEQDTLNMSDIVNPLFGKNYDLILDSYHGLNAYIKNPATIPSLLVNNDTVIIAGDFNSVNGVNACNGWAILRVVNHLGDNDEMITDYVNVVPMMLPRMKCVRIRSAEIENTNLKSLVALGIVEE